jgi:hypothetical protein
VFDVMTDNMNTIPNVKIVPIDVIHV